MIRPSRGLSALFGVVAIALALLVGVRRVPRVADKDLTFVPARVWPPAPTGDVDLHNAEVQAMLERCEAFDLALGHDNSVRESGDGPSDALCTGNQTQVIVLASQWFTAAYTSPDPNQSPRVPTGEMIWAESVLRTLDHWGYSYVLSGRQRGDSGVRGIVDWATKWDSNIKGIWADPAQVKECWEADWCAAGGRGIVPVWKLFSFWYWDDAPHPLGPKWTLSPSIHNDNTPLSFSVEPNCGASLAVLGRREKKRQVYILAKYTAYLTSRDFPWDLDHLGALQRRYGIQFVLGAGDSDPTIAQRLEDVGIVNLGKLTRERFHEELSKSFLLLGVGLPKTSPSPWEALCLGTPFVNPIMDWEEESPDSRQGWSTQNDRMKHLDPPYVYHVHADDNDALEEAIRSAWKSPIGSYVPDDMTFDAVAEYTAKAVEHDWEEEYRQYRVEAELT